MIFDLHCDTLYKLYERKTGKSCAASESELAVDGDKLFHGNYLGQCFAVWTSAERENPYQAALDMIDIFYTEIKKSNILAPALEPRDVVKNMGEGKISALLSLEDAAPIGNDMERLREFYSLGVRMIGLTWNYPNAVGCPNMDGGKPNDGFNHLTPNVKDGLTDFGRELICEMNRLGIVIDVSHLSDAGFFEVAKASKKPFVASHSNARGICPHVRNLTDEMLKILAECGGVVGMNYYCDFLDRDKERGLDTVSCVIRHMKHIGQLIGYDYIALGSDFDGIERGGELDSARDMPKLVEGLSSAGFSESVIEKITSENAIRIFRENT